MPAFLRRFLIVLLVLLQVTTPLAHAHIGQNASISGVHLPEFEILSLIQDGAGLAAIDHELDGQTDIINVGSAIKQQQTIDHAAPVLFLQSDAPRFKIVRDADVVNFSPQPSCFTPELIPNHNTSRAPPFWIFDCPA
jgi:hypothetical protein